jgi:hypothetical protein
VAQVGSDGYVDLLNGGAEAGPVDLIADVTGYFTRTDASGYTSVTPDRLVDTRNGTGGYDGELPANSTLAVQIDGADGGTLPASGVTAVMLNVTVTNPGGSGFLTVYPNGESTPNASNVNYKPGQTVANAVIVPVGSGGMVVVFNGGASAKGVDVIVDVTGYYTPASSNAYMPIAPTRVLDTRDGNRVAKGQIANGGYDYLSLGLTSAGYPRPGITGFVLNATVTNTKGNGFLTVSPDPNYLAAYQGHTATRPVPPNSSTLNWVAGETVPNLVQASSSTGLIDFWNLGSGGGGTDLIVDEFGYYQDN